MPVHGCSAFPLVFWQSVGKSRQKPEIILLLNINLNKCVSHLLHAAERALPGTISSAALPLAESSPLLCPLCVFCHVIFTTAR